MSSASSNSKLKFSKGQCQFEEHYWGENLTLSKTGELGGVLPDSVSFVSPYPHRSLESVMILAVVKEQPHGYWSKVMLEPPKETGFAELAAVWSV